MVLKYRYLGKGVTDSSGIAHMTEDAEGQSCNGYTGTGRGLTDIIASTDDSTHISDSSLLSETFVTIDGIFKDDGVSGTANWNEFTKNGTMTPTSNGTIVTCTSQTTQYMIFSLPPSISTIYNYTGSFAVEFTIESITTGTGNAVIQIYSSETTTGYNCALSQTGHYKITYDGNTFNLWINGEPQTSYKKVIGTSRIGFSLGVNWSITFKDFVVYPI